MAAFGMFRKDGRWFRGNCHTHTTLSDGSLSPADTVAHYRGLGYDFIILTDHGSCHEEVSSLSSEDFLVINGAELHPRLQHDAPVQHHIVALGITKSPPAAWVSRVTAQTVIRWIERNGGIAVYAHPYWSGHNLTHLLEGKQAMGVEIFNTITHVVRGLGDSSVHLDQMLIGGYPWRILAVDDTHDAARDAGGGWIEVKAQSLNRRSILSAIRAGHFYATQGPKIHSLRMRAGLASMECSPVQSVVWRCAGPIGTRTENAAGRMVHAEFRPQADSARFLRVEIADRRGLRAWSQPVFWIPQRRRWEDT